MFCRYCGKQMDDSASVCPACGIAVNPRQNAAPAPPSPQSMQNPPQVQPMPPFVPYPPMYPVYAVPIMPAPKPLPPLAPPAVRRSMVLCWLAVLLGLISLFAGRLQYTLVVDNRAYSMLDANDPNIYHDEEFIRDYEGYSIWGPGAEALMNERHDHTKFGETVRFIEREAEGLRSNNVTFITGLILYAAALAFTVAFAIAILILWIFSHINRNARDYRAAWKNLRASVTLLLIGKITAVVSMIFVKTAVHGAAKLLAEKDYTKEIYTFFRIAPQALITVALLALLRIYILRQIRKKHGQQKSETPQTAGASSL